jgi:CrcB protein
MSQGATLGSVAPYLSSPGIVYLAGRGLALETLTVNLISSFLIGPSFTVSEPGGRLPAGLATRQLVLTRFCGGFTTFSVFSLETVPPVQRGDLGQALLMVAASVCLWLFAVWLRARAGIRLNQG